MCVLYFLCRVTYSSGKYWGIFTPHSMNNGKNSLARNRWSLLQAAIIKKRIPEPKDNPASKRIFEKFSGIIDWTADRDTGKISVEVKVDKNDNNRIATYQASNKLSSSTTTTINNSNNINTNSSSKQTSLFLLTVFRNSQCSTLDIGDLRGYDKTGRICIWPAEQVLAYWCLKNSNRFEGKVVIEIGGGFHCLAGVAIAKYIQGIISCLSSFFLPSYVDYAFCRTGLTALHSQLHFK